LKTGKQKERKNEVETEVENRVTPGMKEEMEEWEIKQQL
jgi:hypothetical protein